MKLKGAIIFLSLTCLSLPMAVAQVADEPNERYAIGTVLFQYRGNDAMDKEIEAIYASALKYYHCGMYIGNGEVIEATSEGGVVVSRLDSWDKERKYEAYAMAELATHGAEIRDVGLRLVGKPYNDTYLAGTDGFYCSELVQYIVNNVLGREVIKSEPMSFGDQPTVASDFWVQYYKDRQMTVPIGEPGTHPTLIAKYFVIIK